MKSSILIGLSLLVVGSTGAQINGGPVNTPAPNESHDVINFGDMTYNTLYAREN